jgi:type VI secretion system protein ImpK
MNPQPAQRRMENLAFVFQELLTVGERLRSNRQQVADAPTFRAQIWGGVKLADDDARKRGYNTDDIELATFAVVAFLDESILNLRSPVFADWPRQPLQEERYGHHIAGEIFFQNLQKLMTRSDSQDLADLLEVYYLCLLLGFAGRYSLGGRGDLQAVAMQTGERIQRIRQTGPELAPRWRLPGDGSRAVAGDPWVFRLAIAAGICFVLLAGSFGLYYWSLSSGVTALQTTARTAK